MVLSTDRIHSALNLYHRSAVYQILIKWIKAAWIPAKPDQTLLLKKVIGVIWLLPSLSDRQSVI